MPATNLPAAEPHLATTPHLRGVHVGVPCESVHLVGSTPLLPADGIPCPNVAAHGKPGGCRHAPRSGTTLCRIVLHGARNHHLSSVSNKMQRKLHNQVPKLPATGPASLPPIARLLARHCAPGAGAETEPAHTLSSTLHPTCRNDIARNRGGHPRGEPDGQCESRTMIRGNLCHQTVMFFDAWQWLITLQRLCASLGRCPSPCCWSCMGHPGAPRSGQRCSDHGRPDATR